MRLATFGTALLLFSLSGLQQSSAQVTSLMAYIAAPNTQTSSQAGNVGALTQTFNSLPLGNQTTPYLSNIGTYQFSTTAKGDILAADQFGGANGSKYMSFGSQSGTSAPITINLNSSYNYFGFWFSAGDPNNGITFYSNGTQFTRFSTADIVSLLSGATVTAINGTTYNSSSYFGNPNNPTQDTAESFTYVEIVTTGTFDKVVLDNSGTTSTGFESDNHTVYAGNVIVPTSDVFVTQLTVVVPEPAHYMVLFGLMIGCLVAGQRYLGRFRLVGARLA